MSSIAERLAQVRSGAGIGVRGFAATLARKTGYRVSHTSVANYETGTTVPAAYAVAVARAFDVDLEWLLTGVGRTLQAPTGPASGANAGHGNGNGASSAQPADFESAFFRLAPEPCFVMDQAGALVASNPAWRGLLGLPAGADASSSLVSHVHVDDRPSLAALRLGLPPDETIAIRFRVRTTTDRAWRTVATSFRRVGSLFYGMARVVPLSPPELRTEPAVDYAGHAPAVGQSVGSAAGRNGDVHVAPGGGMTS